MGTSKGYIAPSTPHWAQAKRGVSMYINNPSSAVKSAAASKYAKAINTEGYANNLHNYLISKFGINALILFKQISVLQKCKTIFTIPWNLL